MFKFQTDMTLSYLKGIKTLKQNWVCCIKRSELGEGVTFILYWDLGKSKSQMTLLFNEKQK